MERACYQELKWQCRLGVRVELLMLIMDACPPVSHPARLTDTAEGRKLGCLKGAGIGLLDHTNMCGIMFLDPGPGPTAKGGKKGKLGKVSVDHETWEGTNVNLSLLLMYLSMRRMQVCFKTQTSVLF